MKTEELLELANLKVKNLRVFLDNLNYILECKPNTVHPDSIISSNQNSIDTCKKIKKLIAEVFNSIEEIERRNNAEIQRLKHKEIFTKH